MLLVFVSKVSWPYRSHVSRDARVPGLRPEVASRNGLLRWNRTDRTGVGYSPEVSAGRARIQLSTLAVRTEVRSALPLLVAQVLTDDHDPSVTTNHFALVADRLDARLDLHR